MSIGDEHGGGHVQVRASGEPVTGGRDGHRAGDHPDACPCEPAEFDTVAIASPEELQPTSAVRSCVDPSE
jgi:hypothetical protein